MSAEPRVTCPSCAQKGRRVEEITPRSLLTKSAQARMDKTPLRFCRSDSCEVVYFDERHGQIFGTDDLTVEVFQKSTHPDRLVCYCFGHSVSSLEREVSKTGKSGVPASIAGQCKAGLDACPVNNPQGSCCLGNVRKVLKAANTPPAKTEPSCGDDEDETHSPCCPPTQKTGPSSNSDQSLGLLSSGGAVVAALFASACCWLPLVLVGLGTSAASVASFFEAYRLHFLAITAVLLGAGYYFVYFRKPKCAPGDACAVPNPKIQRFNRIVLWVATAMVIVFASLPNYVGRLLAGNGSQAVAIAPAATDITRTYSIEGMTCEGCAGHVRSAVGAVSGVKAVDVSYADRSATVRFEHGTDDDEAITKAVASAGYRASPLP